MVCGVVEYVEELKLRDFGGDAVYTSHALEDVVLLSSLTYILFVSLTFGSLSITGFARDYREYYNTSHQRLKILREWSYHCYTNSIHAAKHI